MVSKTVLFALTIVALATGGASLVTSQSFNSCIGAVQTCNVHWGVGLNMGAALSDILGVTVDVMNSVLSLVGNLLGNLLGGSKTVSGPTDLNSALAYINLGLYVNDCGFRKLWGEDKYVKNYMSQIFIYICINALGNSNISTAGWAWLKLDVDFNFDNYCAKLKDCRQYANGDGLLALFDEIDYLLDFMTPLVKDVENLVSTILGDVVSLVSSLIIGTSKSCGYKYYNNCYTTITTTYTPILTSNKCGTINQSYLVRGNYCTACIAAVN